MRIKVIYDNDENMIYEEIIECDDEEEIPNKITELKKKGWNLLDYYQI